MRRICLNKGWSLREAPLSYGKDMAGWVAGQPDGWFENLSVPLDVHMPLIDAGIIRDPVLSDYCFDSEWTERRSWWFKNTFRAEKSRVMELVIESLDVHADLFLNGAYLGHHASAHFPFRREVSEYIEQGENTLIIRLTSGLEYVTDNDLADIDFAVCHEETNGCPERGDRRRAMIRKPTYVFGWDWCPRIGTAAIGKNAYIECHDETAVIRNIALEPVALGPTARLRAELEIELLDIIATADADIEIKLSLGGAEAAAASVTDVLLRSGVNYAPVEIIVKDPRLWWPNGMGAQPLYDVAAAIRCRGYESEYPVFKYGLRTITLDTSRVDEDNRNFVISVNGIPVFCKGANWIPADSIYARVSAEKYGALVNEAADANFNMLRVWGGGIYERDEFYDACDRRGILVWQDMMFGCAAVPDHIEAFYELCGRELDYQTKRLRNRACLALFCGNNENHVIFGGLNGLKPEKQYGLKISNVQMPEIVRKNCAWIPYWNSSPYGGAEANAANVGDVHHWGCMMNPDMAPRIEPREYDKVRARFVSEYGYPGPCPMKTIETYFDGKPVERGSRVWNLHNNTFEKLTVSAGIKKHYTDRELSLEEYLLYGGMNQSLMLGYSLESLRFKEFCGGSLFWMYNDCWGEVGWTIIDYYLRRKISFYGVKRAFEPIKLILRESGADAVLAGCNDTPEDLEFDIKYGYVTFDGKNEDAKTSRVSLKSFTRKALLSFNKGGHDPLKGVWFADPAHTGIRPALLRAADTKNFELPPAKPSVSLCEEGGDLLATVKAETFCHGVYLDVPAEARPSDNYFDLLPGETRIVTVKGGAGREVKIGTVIA